MRAIGRTAPLSSTLHLRYVERGDRGGVPVVFLHGYTDSWRSFEPVLRYLPASVRAIALSQRGHGDSDRPADGYAPRDFAGDVVGLLDFLGLESAVVVGHCMGGFVAQRLALDHPRRVRGLVLASSFTSMRDNPSALELWDTVATLGDPVDPAFARAFQESTLAQAVSPAFLDTVVRESLKVPARVWRAALRQLFATDHATALGALDLPTLIVWGDRDAVVPEREQHALAAGIRGSRLLVYGGAGHGLHWEEPARFAADLVAWLERFGAPQRARTASSALQSKSTPWPGRSGAIAQPSSMRRGSAR